jgi:hypothetical protein
MSAPRALQTNLRELHRQHERIRGRVEQLAEGLTRAQAEFSPGAGRWAIGQILAHLALAAEEQVAIVRGLVDRGREEGVYGTGPFRYSAWGDWYVRFTEPPRGTRLRTITRYAPPPRASAQAAAARFLDLKGRLLRAIDDAEGLDLGRLRAPLPFLPGWNPSLALGQWIAYIAAHERRHLYQIENVQFHPDYPELSTATLYTRLAA